MPMIQVGRGSFCGTGQDHSDDSMRVFFFLLNQGTACIQGQLFIPEFACRDNFLSLTFFSRVSTLAKLQPFLFNHNNNKIMTIVQKIKDIEEEVPTIMRIWCMYLKDIPYESWIGMNCLSININII